MFQVPGVNCVSVADFRDIALEQGPRHGERVLRAAVSAYSSLPHPTRDDATRLDDLALGLYETASVEIRRFAAAALSDCDPAPRLLIRRLAEEPTEISAPVLIRSKALSDVDLIALIARNGIPHARAIARRDNLNPAVAALIRALLSRVEPEPPAPAAAVDQAPNPLEAVRKQLRDLMSDDDSHGADPVPALPDQSLAEIYPALREAALSGEMRHFAEALSTALKVRITRARTLINGVTYADLLTALKFLELSTEQALLLTLAAYPAQVTSPAAIRLFCVRYEALTFETAREKILDWRNEERQERQSRFVAGSGTE